MVTYASKRDAVQAAPPWNYGFPIEGGTDPRRFTFEVLMSRTDATYEWHDLTGRLEGCELARGSVAVGIPFTTGTAQFTLANDDWQMSPWNPLYIAANPQLEQRNQFEPNLTWRVSIHRGTDRDWWPLMTGVVEQWSETTVALGRGATVTVIGTDTWPLLVGEFTTDNVIQPTNDVPSVLNKWVVLEGAKFPYEMSYYGPPAPDENAKLIAGPQPYSGTYSQLVETLATGCNCYAIANTKGTLEIRAVPWFTTPWTPSEPPPTLPTLSENTHQIPADTVVMAMDNYPITNRVYLQNLDETANAEGVKQTSVDLYGLRSIERFDMFTRDAGTLSNTAGGWANSASPQTLSGIWLDERNLDVLLGVDLMSPVDLLHFPPGAPAGVTIGNGNAYVMSLRHRFLPHPFRWRCDLSIDVHDTGWQVIEGFGLLTAGGDRLFTAGGDRLLTAPGNLAYG